MKNLNTMLWEERAGRQSRDGTWNFTLEDSIRGAVNYFRKKYYHLDNNITVGVCSSWRVRHRDEKVKRGDKTEYLFVDDLEEELGIKIYSDEQAYSPIILFVTGEPVDL